MKTLSGYLLVLLFATGALAQSGENWLNGVWAGTGYQIDADETWTMRLTVSDRGYVIEYPSLKCGGVWRIVSQDSDKASFVERITTGKDKCIDDGNVVIERLNQNQVAFRYSSSNSIVVSASGILVRQGR